MSESLKAARERVARAIRPRLAGDPRAPFDRDLLRELQREAMERLLADLEYKQRPDGGWSGVPWDGLAVGYLDELLDAE